jgi:hypothetical protein
LAAQKLPVATKIVIRRDFVRSIIKNFKNSKEMAKKNNKSIKYKKFAQ